MKLDENTIGQAVKIYKALGEPTRIKIIKILYTLEELSCNEIEDKACICAKSTLSHHMKQLADCGLIELRKDGIYHYYRLNKEILRAFVSLEWD
ncbi:MULTISPECIES: ArsR/SmtB family transcription factor [Clostridium]|uniref:Transcriptional regulator n=1 Tax=Clostridium manihotivorum TaxID=2320868 RepID=A0A3R5QU61_9CLOT|nr:MULTISPECIES: metalloregulator ArsR/SmtB family transcription factor [Clostridium]QAA32606.1 transcriptional regulator [Clostridium manihotivorum]